MPCALDWIKTFPVELNVDELPIVNVCLFVVDKNPVPVKNVAFEPLFALMEAVGVPPETPRKANFAEVVAELPINTSRVSLIGESAPDPILQLD
jgi:hypothetical protein